MRKFLSLLAVFALAVAAAASPVEAAPPPTEVTVVGPWATDSTEGMAFVAELSSYAATNRLSITYEGYGDFDELVGRITGPNPPDLVVSPQTGLLEGLAPELIDLGALINPNALKVRFGDYLIDVATVDGAVLGVPIKASLKTLVWYQPDEFTAAGYQIPKTFTELVALSDQMVADGRTPWCHYMESGAATGWVGTDWIEDLLLGAKGPMVYDQWVDHTVLFSDPRVETAFERYQQMIDTPGFVYDRSNVLNLDFFFNAVPLAEDECLMHKQASFFAAGIQGFGYDLTDFSTFAFPSVDPAYGDAAMGGIDYVAAVNDRMEVRQLVRFLAGQRFGRQWLASSDIGWILPNSLFQTSWYTSPLTRSHAEAVHAAIDAGQFRFDGSDMMPPEVGGGTFWFGIVDLVSGTKTIPQVLADIDASWPS